jgi:hypothetical protein
MVLGYNLLLFDLLQDLVFVGFADLTLSVALDLLILRFGSEMSCIVFSSLAQILIFHSILVEELLIKNLPHFTLLLKFLLLFKLAGSF